MAHPSPTRAAVFRFAGLIAAGACLAGAAHADPPTAAPKPASPPAIAGAWKFRTDTLPANGCIISGDITFRKTAKAGEFACRFVSREDCAYADGVKSFQIVTQSCTATFGPDANLAIVSKVEQITDAGPPSSRANLMEPGAYKADDFDVHANGKDELIGLFHSIQRAGVRFWRDVGLVS